MTIPLDSWQMHLVDAERSLRASMASPHAPGDVAKAHDRVIDCLCTCHRTARHHVDCLVTHSQRPGQVLFSVNRIGDFP